MKSQDELLNQGDKLMIAEHKVATMEQEKYIVISHMFFLLARVSTYKIQVLLLNLIRIGLWYTVDFQDQKVLHLLR
jgi:hypothetical protein